MEDKIKGSIYGSVLGDMIGLRYENAKPKNINQENIGLTCLNSVSDDTENLLLITKSLIESKNEKEFKKSFKKQLQKWLLTLPINIGKTTLKSIFKSFKSDIGVKGSGNGSVMRISPVGIYYRNDIEKLERYSEISCRITHNDNECVVNSKAIAKLVALILNNNWSIENKPEYEIVEKELLSISREKFWLESLNELRENIENEIEPIEIVNGWTKNKGAVGYTKYSTLLSIYCWYRYYGNYEKTIKEIIKCGGDTDTNAAIVGSLTGAVVGYNKLPKSWLNKLKCGVINENKIKKICDGLIKKENKIGIKKLILLGWIKNIFLIFYILTLLTYFQILILWNKKY